MKEATSTIHELPRLSPEVLGKSRNANSWSQELRVPSELDCWPGHFPGHPIVPGFLQVDWVMRSWASWIGESPQLEQLQGLKFKKPIRPGQCFRLTLEREADGRSFRFQLAEGHSVFSIGRMILKNQNRDQP